MKCGNCFHVHLDKHTCVCGCDNFKEAYVGQSFFHENNERIARAENQALEDASLEELVNMGVDTLVNYIIEVPAPRWNYSKMIAAAMALKAITQ